MFGYVKPDIPELKVREHDAYRAVYCGICKSAGGALGCVARMELSYDSVFLALSRMLAHGTGPVVRTGRCALHPFKKRPVAEDCAELRFAAYMTAILADAKIKDDRADERGVKKLLAALISPHSGRIRRRALKRGGDAVAEADAAVRRSLEKLGEAEREKNPSLDLAAERFGELTAAVFSAGEEGDAARILREVGRSAGRFIYAADAADDAVRDRKTGGYNPIVLSYGDRGFVKTKDGERLTRRTAEAILRGATLDLGRLPPAVELLCDGGDPVAAAIVKNVIYSGMPKTLNSVVSKNTERKEADPDEERPVSGPRRAARRE